MFVLSLIACGFALKVVDNTIANAIGRVDDHLKDAYLVEEDFLEGPVPQFVEEKKYD
jgi:hypothetical protein